MEFHCKDCGRRFVKESRRGRPPVRCPACRERVKQAWRDKKKEN